MKIEIGKSYKNIHSGRVCTVTDKIFYNVQYVYDNDGGLCVGRPLYRHYKTFKKNWVEYVE